MRRLSRILFAVLLVALGACAAGDRAEPVPTPPDQATTASFVAEVAPAGATAPIVYRWSPEPAVGQGTSAVTFEIAQLASGFVGVTAEQCGAFSTADLALGHDLAPAIASVVPAQFPPPPGVDIGPPRDWIGFDRPIEDWIYAPGQRRIYRFEARSGDRVSIHMERLSGNLDPYLQLVRLSPEPVHLHAFNDNGGEGLNALIDGVFLPFTGTYAVYARGISTSGMFRLTLTRGAYPKNPVPRIERLSPASGLASPLGSDYWVAIYGQDFHPDARVFWNGQLRRRFYSSPDLMYIRIHGFDLNVIPVPPRLAYVTVVNPGPGGGESRRFPFLVNDPFFGESELQDPSPGSAVRVGDEVALRVSWTHPDDSWRVMRHMDLRLRDPEDRIVAWVRAVEGESATSTFELLDADGVPIASGLPGEARVLGNATVTLDLASSTILGSGRSVTLAPRLTFAPGAEGVYAVEVLLEPKEGEAQDTETVGTLAVVAASCDVPLEAVTIRAVAGGP